MGPLCSIYGLYSTEDSVVRYIGQTKQPPHYRLQQHLAEAVRPPGTSRCHRWIRKVLRSGHKIGVIVLETGCPWDEAEKRWIAEFRAKYPGIMTNLSDGGCGYVGPRSEQTRQKMRKPKSEAHRAKLLKHLLSPEVRKKVGVAQRGNTKGRGEKNGNSILTEHDVIEIRRELQDKKSLSAIGKSYGVTKGTISKIRTGRSWRHLGPLCCDPA